MYNADPRSYNTLQTAPQERRHTHKRHHTLRNIFLVLLSLVIFLAGGITTYLLLKNPLSPIGTHPATTPTTTPSASATVSPTPSALVFQKSLYAGTQTGVYHFDTQNNLQQWRTGITKNAQDLDAVRPLAVQQNILYLYNSDNFAPYLYVLSTVNGKVLWQYHLANDARLLDSGRIQFANGSVYIAQSSITDGYAQIIALDALTGRQRWMHHYEHTGVALGLKNSTDFTMGLELQAVSASLLYAVDTMSQSGVITSTFYILNIQDGSIVAQTTSHPKSVELVRAAVLVNNTFYLATSQNGQGFIYTFDATTGKEIWSHAYSADPYDLVVQPNALYLSTNEGSLYALSPQTGDRLWVHVAPGAVSRAMVVNNTIYITEGSFNYQTDNQPENLVALDVATGQPLWSQTLTARTNIRGSVAANPDRLYINLGGNQIGIFSTTNGQLLNRFTLGAAPDLPPLVPVEGVVFMLAS